MKKLNFVEIAGLLAFALLTEKHALALPALSINPKVYSVPDGLFHPHYFKGKRFLIEESRLLDGETVISVDIERDKLIYMLRSDLTLMVRGFFDRNWRKVSSSGYMYFKCYLRSEADFKVKDLFNCWVRQKSRVES